MVQRAPEKGGEDVAPLQRRAVESTVDMLTEAAAAMAGPAVALDAARFNRSLNSWFSMVIQNGRISEEELGDTALHDRLRAAYIAAVRALVRTMAAAGAKSEAELYRINSGRIPLWAWPEPHVLVSGISTPLPQSVAGAVASSGTGGPVTFDLNGFAVTVLPDRVDPGLKSKARTTIKVQGGTPSARTMAYSTHTKITSIGPTPKPTVEIETLYKPGVSPTSRSAYGRGRTAKDMAGAAQLPESQTLAFHEGTHGSAFLEYLGSHAPPEFRCRGVNRLSKFNAAKADYGVALTAYQNAAIGYSEKVSDCVGAVTIDAHNAAEARKLDEADAAAARARGDPAPPARMVKMLCGP